MRLTLVVLGFIIMLGGPFLSAHLFVGCPAIPNPLADCSLAGSFGQVLLIGGLVCGTVLAIWGALAKGKSIQPVES
jgi:hypothetical protein